MKKIGIITSGGDAPGMNAGIRAIVRYGIYLDMEVYGIERGYAGLIEDTIYPLNMRSVSDIVHRGGTILKTARCPEFKEKKGQDRAIEVIKKRGLEGIIVMGGDGSFIGAKILSERGIPTIGIPCTIDNDLPYTDFTIGFDTACNTALDAINKLRDTMTSHERISIVEVMGRHCGDIALYAGIAGGAEMILVPEKKFTVESVCKKLIESYDEGKKSGIIVLAEGAGHAEDLAKEISARTNFEVKSTVLGHIQRGGRPSMVDRILATRCGVHAVKLLKKGVGNRVVGIKNNKIIDMDISEAVSLKRKFDQSLYNIAEIISL
ncbi:MAG: 6-phosphofructokinase [Clostridiales bacterium]|jgi:6-phosphofructokinase 1|nr:6-phosphofructokinase [Clostridiales bacterium]